MAISHLQTVAVYRNRKSGEFRVQPYAKVGAGSQPFGAQVQLPEAATHEDMLEAIQTNLAKNDDQTYDLSRAPCFSPAERQRLLKDDQLIHIERSTTAYRLIPFTKMRNSFGSIDDMVTSISYEEFENNAGELIRSLFRRLP
jgi:hypothetical protein